MVVPFSFPIRNRAAREFEPDTAPQHGARYNIAPTQTVLAIRADNRGREAVGLRWGLVPGWSRGPDPRFTMVNARSETVHAKPAYRGPFRRRRCLIPGEGFYEWHTEAGRKQPYLIGLRGQRLFAMAGLWDRWIAPGGQPVESRTILVTAANPLVAGVHERMPVIRPREHHRQWLDPGEQSVEQLRALLLPYPGDDL